MTGATSQKEGGELRRRSGGEAAEAVPAGAKSTITPTKSSSWGFQALLGWTLRSVPQLLVAGAFTGSAVCMKLLPYLGIGDKAFNKAVVKGYKNFVKTPLLTTGLKPLGVGHKDFMLYLAIAHLIMVALLLIPSARTTAQVSGVYVMAVMIGAEYCSRMTGFAPPGVPKEYVWHAQQLCTGMHLFLFLMGAWCCIPRWGGGRSLGLWSKLFSTGSNEGVKVEAAVPVTTAVRAEASLPGKAPAEQSKASPVPAGSRKRDSTPPPQAGAAGRKGSAVERGAAALQR